MIVGGPFDLIGLPLSSSSVPSALTPPSATSTPGVASTLSSVDAGIVGGAPKSALTGWAASTETSTPFWTRSNRLLNDSLMVSVNTSVPTTKATPRTPAKPVSTERSLRVSSPRSASLYTYATAFLRSSTPAASLPAPSCTTLPSSSTTSRLPRPVLPRAVRNALAVVDHDEPARHRGGDRLVGDHDHRLAELVDGAAQQAEHLLGGVRVQVAGRLVGEQHGRPVHERAGDGDALLLAAGELGRPVRQAVAQPDGLDQLIQPRLVGLAPGERQREHDVLQRGQHGDEVEGLEDEAQPVAPQAREAGVVELGEVLALDLHGA